MNRDRKFATLSMGRPFTPSFAQPSEPFSYEARLMLVFCYPLRVFPPAVPPVIAVISDALAYGVSVSDAAAYTVTLSDA